MIRLSFKAKMPTAEPKPAKGPKTIACKNRACRQRFVPDKPFIRHCSPECGLVIGLEAVAKQKAAKAKKERAEDKAKLATYKRRNDYVAEAQKAFNAFIRERDKDQPCICCGRATTAVQGLHTHGFDCGHYRSTGSAPHLRFDERNAHRQTVFCNRYGGGRAVDYRIGLIARIGLEAVEALEADNEPRKYTVDELKQIRATYTAKLKQLKGE